MPILKQLVSSSSQSKRRSRADLTTEMISAPLGDFRHTMHVGRGGDAFGDTSFLSSRSGEPPRDAGAQPGSPGPKPGLLSRTFRSSKRSQSVTRADKCDSSLAPPGTSSMFVKTAVSLPHLGDEGGERSGSRMPKSLSSSPIKKPPEPDGPAANGAASLVTDTELDERSFGEPTDLPPLALTRPGGGMKHAESIMSFHIDLGPSMLGDILSVMEKGWDEDDLGFEDGRGSEGHWSPLPGTGMEEEKGDGEEPQQAPLRPTRAIEMENHSSGPYTPEPRPRRQNHHHLDSCSVSSSGSGALEEKPLSHLQGGDTDSAKYSSPRGEDEKDFSFMDEDEDEIRV